MVTRNAGSISAHPTGSNDGTQPYLGGNSLISCHEQLIISSLTSYPQVGTIKFLRVPASQSHPIRHVFCSVQKRSHVAMSLSHGQWLVMGNWIILDLLGFHGEKRGKTMKNLLY